MTTLARLCAIIYITICLTTCWLEGNFQIIDDYNWFVRSMGRMVNELETELEDIKEDGDIIMKEGFMMLIFQGIMYEIPPFENTKSTCSKISLCLVLVSVRVWFCHSLDCAITSYHQRMTQIKIHLS